MDYSGRMRVFIVLLCLMASMFGFGCKKEEPIPPPTPERVKAGVEATAERIRKDPKLSPEEKERAIRALYGMAGHIDTSGKR